MPASPPISPPTRDRSRFRTIDGLRGIAAAAVAVFHVNLAISRSAPNWIPGWLSAVAQQGGYGVEIFFVISGFVIAYSVRNGEYSGRYLARFALRRSIRLDPLYWFAIAVELVLIVVSAALFSNTTPFPSTAKILSHLIYAQEILGYGGILSVFWTLTFEIQFYLLFVGLLVLWKKSEGFAPDSVRRGGAVAILCALFASSIVLRYSEWHLVVPGIALLRWFQFFLGVLTWWVVSERAPLWNLLLAYGAVLIGLVVYHATPLQTLPLFVSAFIVVVARRNAFDRVLSARPLQFLGTISYSLYLLHGPIAERWISLFERLLGASFGIGWAWIAFVTATAITVTFSWLAWRFVEAPTMRLSKRVRLPTRAPALTLVTDDSTSVVAAASAG